MTTNPDYHNRNHRTIARLTTITVLALSTLLAAPAPSQAVTTSTDIPAIAGLVAGATGYAHPTSWPPQICSDPTNPNEAFVHSHLGNLQSC